MAEVRNIREWLDGLGLAEHAEAFEHNDIDLEALPHLTDAMLKEMGLSVGVRARLLAGIETLKGSRPAARDAERRHLTVMFCDLVGSTALSETLDPEDLRALMGAYQTVAGKVIAAYDGHVALHLGDGIMAYFGWPAAHEDDAERAVRAALDLVQRVKQVPAPSPLQLHIGIATGLVVVGDSGDAEPDFAVGETPNMAARLQGLAGADEIVIGPATRRLVGSIFDLADAGSHTLKGFAEPVRATRVDGLARTGGRFEARGRNLIPFVGRESEMGVLLERWESAKAGRGQVVLIEGEPGFGKSRLLRELRMRAGACPHAEWFFQCSPYHASSALYPVIDRLERAAGFAPGDDANARLDKLTAILSGDDETRALYATLLSLESDRYAPPGLTPQKQKELTLRAIVAELAALSRDTPVLLLFEDAHWVDPTTQQALDLMLRDIETLRVLAVITFRPEYAAPWSGLSHATLLRLARLDERDAEAMVESAASGLSDELRARIVARTEGVPLFVEELTNAVRDRGAPGTGDASAETALAIPDTLHESLTARLDRLGPSRELAQLAACIGRRFSRSLLAAVHAAPDAELDARLSALEQSGLVYPERLRDGPGFAFKHFLVQQAAYSGLLRTTRRKIHGDIAEALIARHDGDHGSDPIVVAEHLQAADRIGEALPWLRRAAERAADHGSVRESMDILDRALDLLGGLQASPEDRDRAELELQMARLPVSIALTGWASADANRTCARALDLAVSLGDRDAESAILYQRATMHEVRGEFSNTQAVLARREVLLGRAPEPEPVVESGELMACSTFYQGRFDTSIEHARLALDHADPQQHTVLGATLSEDPTIACLFWIAKSLLLQGRIDQARARQREALDCARRSPNWYAESQAELDAAVFFAYQREFDSAIASAERAMESSARVGLAYREAVATLIREWGRAVAHDAPPDLERLEACLAVFRDVGAMIGYGVYLSLAAEAYAHAGRHDRAEELIAEAIEICAQSRGFFYEGELHRLAGDLKLARGGTDAAGDAEGCYGTALETAKAQGALLYELRATGSLARLWRDRGRTADARDLLAPVYGRFTEGFGAADVIRARELLETLA